MSLFKGYTLVIIYLILKQIAFKDLKTNFLQNLHQNLKTKISVNKQNKT